MGVTAPEAQLEQISVDFLRSHENILNFWCVSILSIATVSWLFPFQSIFASGWLNDVFPCHHNHQCWSNWFHFEVIFCCFHSLPSNLILQCALCMEGKPILFQGSSNKMTKHFSISVCLRQIFYIHSTGLKFVSVELNLSLYLSKVKILFR